jgi:hypothetical protein
MRPYLALALLIAAPVLHAQTVDWHAVNLHNLNTQLAPAHLTSHQQAAIRTLIVQTLQDTSCDMPDGFGDFTYSVAPIGRPGIVYVSPGDGCLRGAQGSNASLWLVDTSTSHLHFIARPNEGFEGWGLGIQAHTSHGLHDVVTGWHMGADDIVYTYFRFDGTLYRKLSQIDISD